MNGQICPLIRDPMRAEQNTARMGQMRPFLFVCGYLSRSFRFAAVLLQAEPDTGPLRLTVPYGRAVDVQGDVGVSGHRPKNSLFLMDEAKLAHSSAKNGSKGRGRAVDHHARSPFLKDATTSAPGLGRLRQARTNDVVHAKDGDDIFCCRQHAAHHVVRIF